MNAIVKIEPTNFVGVTLDQSKKESLNAWMKCTNYCHYFSITFPNYTSLFFFSIEELNETLREIEEEQSDSEIEIGMGSVILESAMRHTECKYRKIWQQKHKERLANLEEQRKQAEVKHQARKEKMLKRLEYDVTCEDSCHYFCVFQKGKEVYPFGIDQIPYFSFEEAEKARQHHQLFHSENLYYIGMGAFDTDYMLRADGNTNTAEQHWIDQHKQRLESLFNQGEFIQRNRFFCSAEDKTAYQEWLKTALNSVDHCHSFVAEAEDEHAIYSSFMFYTMIEAVTYIAKKEMTNNGLNYTIKRRTMSTKQLNELDGKTEKNTQHWINQHKARLQGLALKESA